MKKSILSLIFVFISTVSAVATGVAVDSLDIFLFLGQSNIS